MSVTALRREVDGGTAAKDDHTGEYGVGSLRHGAYTHLAPQGFVGGRQVKWLKKVRAVSMASISVSLLMILVDLGDEGTQQVVLP